MRKRAIGFILAATVFIGAAPPANYHLIAGQVTPGKGPDGNSIFLDTSAGLVLVDTGRHPEHREKLLAFARQGARPIVAIFNTHWHLDHTTGNAEIRGAYPRARVYATDAVEGALLDFFPKSRKDTEDFLNSGRASRQQRAEILRAFHVMDHPAALRATDVVQRRRTMTIGGRRLEVRVAPFAATEADLWIYDPSAKLAIVGDLVVGLVPFMDTACPDGWRKALDEVAGTGFEILIPGHGAPMGRAEFLEWKAAFGKFVDCGRSAKPSQDCVAGWMKDARRFIAEPQRTYAAESAAYYIQTRLRGTPAEQQRYCKPLRRS